MVTSLLPVFLFLSRSWPVFIWKINDLQLKFCGAVGLVKNWKVAKFGFNPISQFRTRLVFMTEICIFSYFSVFSQFWLNFASARLRKRRTEANFCHLLAFAKPAAPQKFQPQITIKTGQDWLRPKRPVKDWRPSLGSIDF